MPDDTIRFQEADYDLAGLETLTWELLNRGAQTGREALHAGTLSTLSDDDFPASRTMVLRQVDAQRRLLGSYSDVRAHKVAALRRFPRVSWVFYDARRRVEVRAMGTMRVFTGAGDSLAEAIWAGLNHSAQHAFAGTQSTGTRLAERAPDLVTPSAAHVAARSAENFGNFAVLLTFVERLEFLHLSHAGHHRARFVYRDGDLVERHWVST